MGLLCVVVSLATVAPWSIPLNMMVAAPAPAGLIRHCIAAVKSAEGLNNNRYNDEERARQIERLIEN